MQTTATLAGLGLLLLPSLHAPQGASVRVAHLPLARGRLPGAFLPLDPDRVILADRSGSHLREVFEGVPQEPVPLRGDDFDPARCHVADMAPGDDGELLLLDDLSGTIWRSETSGAVVGRFGSFHAPTRMGRGADGLVYVVDAGADRLLGFRRGVQVRSLPLALRLEPYATRAGLVPFLDRTPESVTVRLARPGPEPLSTLELATIPAPPGRRIWWAQVVGVTRDALQVEVRVAEPEAHHPTSLIVEVATSGATAGRVTRAPLDRTRFPCADCGPGLRVDPRGHPIYLQAPPGGLEIWTTTTGGEG